MSQIRVTDKVVDVSYTKENRCRRCSSRSVKQKQLPVHKVQKKIEIPQLQLVQETMRSEIRSMALEKDV